MTFLAAVALVAVFGCMEVFRNRKKLGYSFVARLGCCSLVLIKLREGCVWPKNA